MDGVNTRPQGSNGFQDTLTYTPQMSKPYERFKYEPIFAEVIDALLKE